MNAEEMEGMLIDYIDGKLNDAEKLKVERELAGNPEVAKLHAQLSEVIRTMEQSGEWEPGKRLKQNFEQALKEEILSSGRVSGRQVFFSPLILRVAAGIALVLSGIAIGHWINKNQQREAELVALKEEVEATKRMMISMLDNQQSASQRMQGATVAFTMDKPDDQIVAALAKAMNEDPNTNVRLAALEALGKFHQQAPVRKALILSLATQKDPIVQIALIRLVVEMKEKDAVNELKRITTDEMVLPAVKDEAHAGLLKLS